MDKVSVQKLNRVVVYPKDVQRITGKSERYGRKLLSKIKECYDKERHQYVSIEEFSEYTGLPVELVEKHIVD